MAFCPIYTKSQKSHPYLKGNVIQDVTIIPSTRKKSFVNLSGDVPLSLTNTALGLRDDSLVTLQSVQLLIQTGQDGE